MGRRKKRDSDWLDLVPQLAGLVILLCFISPNARQFFSALSFLTVSVGGIVVLAMIGWTIFRRNAPAADAPSFQEVNSVKLNANSPQFPTDREPSAKPAPNLHEQLHEIDWFQFEKLIAMLYRKLGYVVSRRGGANPDGGIDLVIERDGQLSAIQCKQWKTWNVGVRAVREFLGALTDAGIQQGVFITLCGYTNEAKQLAAKHGIKIVDENELVKMLETTDANYDLEMLSIFQDTRKFCPKCENQMVVRTAGKGSNAGNQFWGCSKYPACRFTMPL
jgi:hypothetical protein